MILGLDIGVASVGWALLKADTESGTEPTEIIDCGARVFQEPLEAKTRNPKNAARRQKRMMRRILARRRMRRDLLVNTLRMAGLLPSPGREWEELFHNHASQPYLLRSRGVTEALSLHEFGRVLFHLSRRRGYLSNRRAERMDLPDDPEIRELVLQEEEEAKRKETERAAKLAARRAETGKPVGESDGEDDGEVLAAIAALERTMKEGNYPTLGVYLQHCLTHGVAARGQHATRQMYEREFDVLWESQRKHHPRVLTEKLRLDIHHAIFFQRPLKAPMHVTGKCQFEKDRPCAPRAHPLAQRFRALQDLNHLNWRLRGQSEVHTLSETQRRKVLAKLEKHNEVSWSTLGTLLGLPKGEVTFNLESVREKGLLGLATEFRLAKALQSVPDHGPHRARPWHLLSAADQREFLTDLFTIDRRDALLRRLRKHWGFDAATAYELAKMEFERGRTSLSLKAITKILPHLEAGLNYHDAFQAAGYLRPDQKARKAGTDLIDLSDVPDARNPVVNKSLHEVRKVVNAICRTYGTPTIIRIELARDMKLTKLQKAAAMKAKALNDKANAAARDALANPDFGIANPSRADLIKYRLWLECSHRCPYTGKAIAQSELFSGKFDIEHISPYSRSLDDSIKNKTLCCADYNRHVKRNQTPWECASGEDYEKILQRVDEMRCGRFKKNRFRKPKTAADGSELGVDHFAQRQLNDTRHACLRAKQMLAGLGSSIQVSAGESTAALRHAWGLNSVLSEDGEKNRSDHRHHAVDAIVVACTSIRLFQRLSILSARSEASLTDQVSHTMAAAVPWQGFRADVVAAIQRIVVSHQITRKVRGALHEETAYGKALVNGETAFVSRKPVASLTAGEVERVRDAGIKRLILERLREAGANLQDKKSIEATLKKGALNDSNPLYVLSRHGERKVVRRVRIVSRSGEGRMIGLPTNAPVRYHPTGGNHCAHIYENPQTGERTAEVVPLYFAADKSGRVMPTACPPGWVRVMTLYRNDLVEIADAEFDVYRVVKFAPESNNVDIRFRPAQCALDSLDIRFRTTKSLGSIIRVLNLDALGR